MAKKHNGDLIRVFGQLLDEKLAPLKRDIVETKIIVRGLGEAVGRIETRLRVVEAILGIDPKH